MDRQRGLSIIRAAYAKQILAAACVENARIEDALSEIRREDFLGLGPWQIWRWGKYAPTPSADPVYLYTNDLVGILPEQHLNNGLPSLHAFLIHKASPVAGEHVVHIGTGTGYYTAMFAHLVVQLAGSLELSMTPNSPLGRRPILHATPTSKLYKVTALKFPLRKPMSSTSTLAALNRPHFG